MAKPMADHSYVIHSRADWSGGTYSGRVYTAVDSETGRALCEVHADGFGDAQLRLAALVREVRAGK